MISQKPFDSDSLKATFVIVMLQKTINELLDENFVYARALHYLGVDFFTHSNKQLREICEERGLNKNAVIKTFYAFDSKPRIAFKELEDYPPELLIQYLKHNHYSFIKEKIPFIVYLVNHTESDLSVSHLLPEFIEEFIIHIYEEEDTIFNYVSLLNQIKKDTLSSPSKVLFQFADLSLTEELEHHKNEDEFAAIRTLLKTFEPQTVGDKLLVEEIKSFDRELTYHSEIENEIFFPKAIALEEEIFKSVKELSKLNG